MTWNYVTKYLSDGRTTTTEMVLRLHTPRTSPFLRLGGERVHRHVKRRFSLQVIRSVHDVRERPVVQRSSTVQVYCCCDG